MAEPERNVLRYFDARGRAQFLRYFIRARGLDVADERVPLDPDFAAWRALRPDRSRTGPFQKLPVLQWQGRLVAETRVIYAFLQAATGDATALGPERALRHDMLVSSLCDDVMHPIGILIWSGVMFPGADAATVAKRSLERLQAHCAVLDQTLREWSWLEEAQERSVMLADCLLWEELDVAQHVFGEHLRLEEHPYLFSCYREAPGADTFRGMLAERPRPVTARPGESEAIADIRALLAA